MVRSLPSGSRADQVPRRKITSLLTLRPSILAHDLSTHAESLMIGPAYLENMECLLQHLVSGQYSVYMYILTKGEKPNQLALISFLQQGMMTWQGSDWKPIPSGPSLVHPMLSVNLVIFYLSVRMDLLSCEVSVSNSSIAPQSNQSIQLEFNAFSIHPKIDLTTYLTATRDVHAYM